MYALVQPTSGNDGACTMNGTLELRQWASLGGYHGVIEEIPQ
jgi:hypothetical protein